MNLTCMRLNAKYYSYKYSIKKNSVGHTWSDRSSENIHWVNESELTKEQRREWTSSRS